MVVWGGASGSRGGKRGGRGRGMHYRHTTSTDRIDRRSPIYPQGIQDSPLSHTQSLQGTSLHHLGQNDTTNIADDSTCPIDAWDDDLVLDHIAKISPPSSASSRTRGLNQGTLEPTDLSTR